VNIYHLGCEMVGILYSDDLGSHLVMQQACADQAGNECRE
jgi:hypothetical protein